MAKKSPRAEILVLENEKWMSQSSKNNALADKRKCLIAEINSRNCVGGVLNVIDKYNIYIKDRSPVGGVNKFSVVVVTLRGVLGHSIQLGYGKTFRRF